MLTVAIPKRNKLQNIIVLTPKDGPSRCILLRCAQDSSRKTIKTLFMDNDICYN